LNLLRWFSKRRKYKSPLVSVESRGTTRYVIASTEHPITESNSISMRLTRAGLIEANINPRNAVKTFTTRIGGVTYPDDFNDFRNYLDAYYYVPYVTRAINVKQFMLWQRGYDLESTDEDSKMSIERFLMSIEADTVIRDGTLYALIFGNMYWRIERNDGNVRIHPLNPMKVGIKLNAKDEVEYYVYTFKLGKTVKYTPDEILHLKFNAEPWNLFGVSTLRCVLPTVKAILFMEEKLPWIARRRADPLLNIQIGGPENPVSPDQFRQIRDKILSRKPGEDIFHDGTVKIEEVYRSPGIGARQAIEPLLKHFRDNLVAGLGVPEPALGFGGTTTKATAEYQERILEAEIRSYQRAIKRMHENQLFRLIRTECPVKLVWRPLKTEDLYQLSKKLMDEIEHGVISPRYARQRLGYPDEAGEDTVIDQRFVPRGR